MMLALALATTLIQQTLSYMAMIVVPVAAPELAKVMDADIGWIGYYSAILLSIVVVHAVLGRTGPALWCDPHVADSANRRRHRARHGHHR